MTLSDLHRVQEIDYNLLCAVDEICKKNDIQYFLFFGALLGAIRHKGQIPWDDDIDIAMTRENYLRFLQIAPNELDSSKYFLTLMGSGSSRYVSEVKIGDKRTIYCMPGCEDSDIMNSVTLDVFCLEKAKKYSKPTFLFLKRIVDILWICKQNSSEKKLLKLCVERSEKKHKWFYKLGLDLFSCIRFILGEKFFEWIAYKLFVDEKNKSDLYWERTSPHYFKAEWIRETIEADFGIKQFPIPIGFDEILKEHYGDYMKLPPEEKRFNKSFKEWVFIERK